MTIHKRKYCGICRRKYSPTTFNLHRKVCQARRDGKEIQVKCLYCSNTNPGNYGSGAYCCKQCMYSDRKRHNKTCPVCQRSVSSHCFKAHVASCQGEGLKKFCDISSWKVGDNLYQCPQCSQQFPKMGILSHFIKIHGQFPGRYTTEKNNDDYRSKTCLSCETPLGGKKRKYCSLECKRNFLVNGNSSYSQRRRGIKRKIELILLKGGKCEKCGYDKNLSSLCFHHIDEKSKSFNLCSRTIASYGMTTILEEVEKCQLLCHNCHNEHHNPDLELKKLKKDFRYIFQ